MDYTIIWISLMPMYVCAGLAIYAIGIKNTLLLGGAYVYANAIQHIYQQ